MFEYTEARDEIYRKFYERLGDMLKMLGTANATGAVAAGAAFKVFSASHHGTGLIKFDIIVFLIGVVAFAFSYPALAAYISFLDRIDLGKKCRASHIGQLPIWREMFGNDQKRADEAVSVCLVCGAVSLVCFYLGLATAISLATGI